MMAAEDAAIRSMLPDYRIHLVSPVELSRRILGSFIHPWEMCWSLSSIPWTKIN